jgi:alkylation response protein AidB-like acyl-CoA dehydrogenase
VDLDFTPEQELLRDTVRGVCARHAGLDVVRRLEDDPVGYPEKLWLQMAELGLLGLTLPERWGGSGMSMLDAAIVYEELGRALAPSPHFVSSVVSAGVLERVGSDEQRARWLPAIAAGDAILTPAWLEPGRGFGPDGVRLEAAPDDSGWRLTGTKRHVQFARAADRLLVLARTPNGVGLFLVDPTAEGVSLTQQETIASDTQFEVRFAGAAVAVDARVGADDTGWAAWVDVMHDGVILLAAQAAGGARYALDITVQYAKDRRQFDKPLGAFQAVAHYPPTP